MKHIKTALSNQVGYEKDKSRKFSKLALVYLIPLLALLAYALYTYQQKPLSPIPPIYDPVTGQVYINEADLQDTKLGKYKTAQYMIVLNPDAVSGETATAQSEVKLNDRAKVLKQYLQKHNSPLADYADLIILESDRYGLPWTRIVAITRIETSFGTNLSGAYNGGNIMAFSNGRRIGARNYTSWEEWIKDEARLLGTKYSAIEVAATQQVYCPSYECSSNWQSVVNNTNNELLELAQSELKLATAQ